jgi:1-acyl-sn-glycerol-3-phosphate acyltransferase
LHGTTPPQFFATDAFHAIPGVASLFDMFRVITIKAKASKDGQQGRSANAEALDEASRILQHNGCVAVFPQGNFARIGQKPPRIYNGTATLAVTNKMPIHVIRLDGFWSLSNPVIPVFIRNNTFYRAFFALFHMNRVRVNLCDVIDVHLQAEHENSSDEEKIEAINARLYACYRQTEELTPEKIDKLKSTFSEPDNIHLSIWRNKVRHDKLIKELAQVETEASELEERAASMMAI